MSEFSSRKTGALYGFFISAPQEHLGFELDSIDSPKFSRAFGDGLSRLVHQRAARKPISDSRTATYVILSTGSGPGGRWFKSIRSDQTFRINESTTYKAGKFKGRLVQGYDVDGWNPCASTILCF